MTEISSTADQMLELLEIIAAQAPLTTAQLAQKTGINRTVAHRLVTTLHRRGYVMREGKAYILGPRLALILGKGGARNIMELVDLLHPIMHVLSEKTQETVIVHHMDGFEAIVVAQSIPQGQLVRVQHREGSRHGLTLGASGRALLAFQSPGFINRVKATLAAPLERESLQNQLDEIRHAGIAHSKDELQDGVIGMAVPLHETAGKVGLSLALLAPQQRAPSFHTHQKQLLQAQKEMEAIMRGQA